MGFGGFWPSLGRGAEKRERLETVFGVFHSNLPDSQSSICRYVFKDVEPGSLLRIIDYPLEVQQQNLAMTRHLLEMKAKPCRCSKARTVLFEGKRSS